MKFHAPSFMLGVGVTLAAVATRDRLRPVAVEIAALATHLGRVFLGVAERQREQVEDLWAEIEDRARRRARRPDAGEARA